MAKIRISAVAAVVLLFMLSVLSYSQESGSTGGGSKLLERRILQKKFFTLDEILDTQKETKQMFQEDRMALYERFQKKPGDVIGALALNMLVPGTGSLLLGDIEGGVTLLSVGLTGAAIIFVPSMIASLFSNNVYDSNYAIFVMVINIMPALGAVVFLSASVVGMILPFTYSNIYNSNLRMGLGLASADHSQGNNVYVSARERHGNGMMNLRLLEFRF